MKNRPAKHNPKIRRLKSETEASKQEIISSLKLNKFRDFPSQREFKFGKVNLIFGRNGSGKTSLLEAIEFFYCGTNKRNPKAEPRYSMNVVFADGKSEAVITRRTPQVFRDRNLMCMGNQRLRRLRLRPGRA